MAFSDKIRIMIVDDHQNFRRAINGLLMLEADFDIVGEAQDGLEAIENASKLRPNVILMDIDMPKMNGIEATKVIAKKYPEISIIGFSIYEDEWIAKRMKQAGARIYINKFAPIDQLIRSIRLVRQ